jgi:hypothetical protein
MFTPHDGEMMDYYVMPKPGEITKSRYHVSDDYFYCIKQVYKDHINGFNTKLHQLRFIVFILCVCVFIGIAFKHPNSIFTYVTGALILFSILYYGSMLYSSRFMPRYIIPSLQLQTLAIALLIIFFTKRSIREIRR